jgi:uncharacterized protein YoxC
MGMNEILHANIFFIIASIGVVVFIIITSIILYQVLKVVKAVRRIVERVERGSEVLAEDIEDLRHNLNPTRIISFIMSLIPGMKR